MCLSIHFETPDLSVKMHFTNPKAKLPVQLKNNRIAWLPWGRHRDQAGNLPMGGWAPLSAIQNQQWDPYFPKAVKVAHIKGFMEKDIDGKSRWFALPRGQCIQGVVTRYDKECRVYIVTITPEKHDNIYQRWPRIISSPSPHIANIELEK